MQTSGQASATSAGQGWWGAVSSQPVVPSIPASSLPFGSYVAASLAAAEVFLCARLPVGAYVVAESAGWDCWTQAPTPSPARGAPAALSDLNMSGTALAGAGAVGTVWMHAIWATPGVHGDVLVADADKAGVTSSNLNRCPLFGTASLGQPKTAEAARICPTRHSDLGPAHGPVRGPRDNPRHTRLGG